MTTEFTLLIIVAALFIGLSKGGLGGPVPVVILTPLLSQIMPTSQAIGLVLPLLLVGDALALSMYWKKWDDHYFKLMLPTGILGTLVGSLCLMYLAKTGQNLILQRILGLLTLSMVLYKVGGTRLQSLKYEPRRWHGRLAGFVSGFGSGLANVGAPPFSAYMMLQGVPAVPFIGTATVFFAIVNLLKLPVTLSNPEILNIERLKSIWWAFLIIPIAVVIGRKSVKYVNQTLFERFMLLALFGLSLYMLFYTPPGAR